MCSPNAYEFESVPVGTLFFKRSDNPFRHAVLLWAVQRDEFFAWAVTTKARWNLERLGLRKSRFYSDKYANNYHGHANKILRLETLTEYEVAS